MRDTVSVVIPVFFNEGSLPDLFSALERVEAQLLDVGTDMELVFVDDGSEDGSLQQLLRIKEKRPATKVVKLTRNFGVVNATKSGFKFVTGDCFAVLAADLQDPPELILQMVEKWKSGSMFTVCVRAKRSDPVKVKIFSRMYYWMIQRIVIRDFPRGGFDLFLLDSKMLPHFVSS
ncbi:glycosyltransferase family 2 protein, partial [Arenicellales bacterium IMCC56312]